jgi:nickel/cobalt exporter
MIRRILSLTLLGMLVTAGVAMAHPLGNFSVNHYNGLNVHPDRIDVTSVVDLAEIPTLQEKSLDPSRECANLAGSLRSTVDDRPLTWQVRTARVERPNGQADLATTRLTCELTAAAEVRGPVTLTFKDDFRSDRVGWHEITAVGTDVKLSSPVPSQSVSNELRRYPDDLLSSPLDVREVRIKAEPGVGTAAGPVTEPRTGGFGLASAFTDLVGRPDLTPLLGILAVLLSLVLGASHAALPGHGKTVIAAYLVGRRGTPKDAIVVGATVTLTHTAGVLVLGLLISLSSVLAGESVLRWLGILSGVLIAGIGVFLVRSALRQRKDHGHGHGHAHGHGVGHGHGHGVGRSGLIGMGVAGGLVPSPSALVVLLGAIALGRTWFGVLLVLGYGIGMAAMLMVAGLVLVKVRDRFESKLRRYTRLMPILTSVMVLVVGTGLAVRAITG